MDGRLRFSEMAPLDRRSFLAGAACVVMASACGGGGSNRSENANTASGASRPSQAELGEIAFVALTFPDGFSVAATLVHGVEQRLPVVVHNRFDTMRETAPDRLRIAVTGRSVTVFDAEVDAHRDGIITPYYAPRVQFPSPGEYRLRLPDHPEVNEAAFVVADPAEVAIAGPGDELPLPRTPTFADDLGVTPVCTRAIPCPFHEHDLAEAAVNGRPTALLIATPGYCQTDICGPVVDLLMEAAPELPGMDFVHAEVYVDPSEFSTGRFPETTAAVQAMGLPYEPALFVADGDAVITARLDITWDRSELAAALATAA